MNETTRHLAIAFGTLGGVLLILLALALSRFYFASRKERRLRRAGQAPLGTEEKDGWAKSGLGWLFMPGRGPGGTRTFMGGIFGLDAPPDHSAPHATASDSSTTRKSHFSSAGRRSARSRRQAGSSLATSKLSAGGATELGMKDLTLVTTNDPFRRESRVELIVPAEDRASRWSAQEEGDVGLATDEDERPAGPRP